MIYLNKCLDLQPFSDCHVVVIDIRMGLLTSGAFATALLGILLIYYSVTSLEASTEEDFSSNEVNTGSIGSNLLHQYELDEAQQKIKLLESKLSLLESRMPQVN